LEAYIGCPEPLTDLMRGHLKVACSDSAGLNRESTFLSFSGIFQQQASLASQC